MIDITNPLFDVPPCTLMLLRIYMLSGLQAGTEYMSSPITPLMDKSAAHTRPSHRKVNGRAPSTTSTTSKGRLYYYVSGSDADDDDNETSSSGNPKQHGNWRKGSHSTVSSSNDIENCRLRNDHVSQLSLSDSDREDECLRQYTQTGNASLIMLSVCFAFCFRYLLGLTSHFQNFLL